MSLRIRRGTNAQRATTPLDLGELVFTTDTKQLYVGNGIDNGGDPIIRLGTGLAWADVQCTTIIATGAALQVSADPTPILGGNLSLNTHDINGTGNVNITGNLIASGTLTATTGLGANLSLNSYNINGTGNILTTGLLSINATGNIQFRQLIDGINSNGYTTTVVHRGTFLSPTRVFAGDELGGILMRGYTSNTVAAQAAIISVIADPTAVIAGGNYVKSIIAISASTDAGSAEADAVIIDSAGVITSNAFVASKYTQLAVYAGDAARTSAIPTPAKGMMVFMTSGTAPTVTNKSVVYDGSAWVALH